MVKRHNHYESAFEDYLRSEQIPYIAVNEQRRALESDGSLKNLDFILSPDQGYRSHTASADPLDYEAEKSSSFCDKLGWEFESYGDDSYPVATQWLVDIKGRRFPSGSQYWRNWTTRDELESLERWLTRFGNGFDAGLIFSYQLVGNRSPIPVDQLHFFQDEAYAFVAVSLYDYWSAAKTLSSSWGTVSVPTAEFKKMARPIGELLGARPMARQSRLKKLKRRDPRNIGFENRLDRRLRGI